jgi:hypothetical protein
MRRNGVALDYSKSTEVFIKKNTCWQPIVKKISFERLIL